LKPSSEEKIVETLLPLCRNCQNTRPTQEDHSEPKTLFAAITLKLLFLPK
jgi:hypothetical protein